MRFDVQTTMRGPDDEPEEPEDIIDQFLDWLRAILGG
jgi:hypothetical protein